MRLKDKVAIVTGGASGFGLGIAQRFSKEGARVLIADVDDERGQAAAQQIQNQGGVAIFAHCDVSRGDDVAGLLDVALRECGGLHIVVNNAGTTHRNRPLLEVSEMEFDRVYAVNVKSIYWTAKHFVPYFRAQGSGCFVNIASTAAIRPRPGLTWYNGSKGAVVTLSKSMAAELGPDQIRVNCVNPVIGDTALVEEFMGVPDTPENRKKFLAGIPLGRFSTPADIASAALYLASDEAGFITGTCLEVDGGRCV
ncbi:SDR family oxidoreductase [Alcaligenes endophyticus]|uniref:SDR family oxidoreductase n=1 Tax=Alcaligenes endophyticus TaxID=1929088 RepID=A0ABT8EH06_9BURK|nr:SDR family oxidoreductase [Alcaligenes endophyticus]MCX5589790.1 SDR family oxidoreductase [Alcaligenes endophyticus]MDN4120547.1 SDR family oxidoreductase [Alcaligenes endophyticus]